MEVLRKINTIKDALAWGDEWEAWAHWYAEEAETRILSAETRALVAANEAALLRAQLKEAGIAAFDAVQQRRSRFD